MLNSVENNYSVGKKVRTSSKKNFIIFWYKTTKKQISSQVRIRETFIEKSSDLNSLGSKPNTKNNMRKYKKKFIYLFFD